MNVELIKTLGFPAFCLIIVAMFSAKLVKYITEDIHLHLKDINDNLCKLIHILEQKHNKAFDMIRKEHEDLKHLLEIKD